MKHLSGLGFISTVSGIVLLVFKLIAAATQREFYLADLSLSMTMAPETLEKLDQLTNSLLRTCAENIVMAPLYLHLIIFGIIILIIGGLTTK